MSSTPLEDSDKDQVIRTLNQRIVDLEALLERTRQNAATDSLRGFRNYIRVLRLFGVVPLYSGDLDYDALRVKVASHLNDDPVREHVVDAVDEVWLLSQAPLPVSVREQVKEAIGGGLYGWA